MYSTTSEIAKTFSRISELRGMQAELRNQIRLALDVAWSLKNAKRRPYQISNRRVSNKTIINNQIASCHKMLALIDQYETEIELLHEHFALIAD